MTDNANRGADPAVVKTVAKVLDMLEHLGCVPGHLPCPRSPVAPRST